MRDLLLTLLVFGLLPAALVRPSIGLLVWAWLGYMNPHRLTWGFAYNLPFVQVTAIATLAGLLVGKDKWRFPWSGLAVIWLLWALWLCVTTPFALNPAAAVLDWERAIKIQVMILVTLLVIHSRERINQLVWVIVISIGFYGMKGGLFTALTGGTYRVWGPMLSYIQGNNELAVALLMIVPLMRYLQLHSENRWVRRGLAAVMVLSIMAILGTYSRGALVGGAAMLLMVWFRSRHKLAFGVPSIIVALLAVMFMPDKWLERMGTIGTYSEDASALGRINAWYFAVNLAVDRPLLGGGFSTFTPDLFYRYAPKPRDFHDAHSIYFQVLGEQGFIGLVLFLLIGVLSATTASWVMRNTRGRPDLVWMSDLAGAVQAGLVAYAVGGAFLGLAYFDLPYHLMAIVLILRAMVHTAKQEKSATVQPEVQFGVPVGDDARASRR